MGADDYSEQVMGETIARVAAERERVRLYLMKANPLPTVDQIADLCRKLTGREPTAEEMAEAKLILDGGDGMKPRTLEEQSLIDLVAKREGREWAEAHAELILEQARAIGDLPPAGQEVPTAPVKRVYQAPIIVDGVAIRLIEDESGVGAEVFVDGAWVPGSGEDIYDTLTHATASPERLAALGIPPCNVGDPA